MNLLDQIIESCTMNPPPPLASVLRQCILLSSQLKVPILRTWAERELNGYEPLKDQTPAPTPVPHHSIGFYLSRSTVGRTSFHHRSGSERRPRRQSRLAPKIPVSGQSNQWVPGRTNSSRCKCEVQRVFGQIPRIRSRRAREEPPFPQARFWTISGFASGELFSWVNTTSLPRTYPKGVTCAKFPRSRLLACPSLRPELRVAFACLKSKTRRFRYLVAPYSRSELDSTAAGLQ
jgi:hypothetical protein